LLCIFEPVFRQHFKEFRVERADKIAAPGMIDSQVINRLLEAELVIIDMSMQNANAFYEMGIRHMKRLPTIHMYRDGETIPFDVKPYRAIPFKIAHPNDLETAKGALKAAVEEATKKGFEVENPVTRARGVEQLDEHAMPGQKVLLQQIQALEDRLHAIERRVDSSFDRPLHYRTPAEIQALIEILRTPTTPLALAGSGLLGGAFINPSEKKESAGGVLGNLTELSEKK
jgi:hypothetical protein